MNYRFLKQSVSLGTLAALSLAQSLVMTVPVKAETTARLDGRCKLTSDDMKVFDGHCTVKHKQRDNTNVVVVKMDNGSDYRFFGPNSQAFQVETYGGIHNVQYKENDPKEVFTWDEDGDRQKLAVILDSQKPAVVSHDDNTAPQQDDLGTLIGAGVGALIGSLISGGGSNQTASNSSSSQGSGSPDDDAKINARIGAWGRICKNEVAERLGSDVSMADINVTLSETTQSSIDAGEITLSDINQYGLTYNWSVPKKKAAGYCGTDGKGQVKEFEFN